jgi:hypothetical protein
MALSNEWENMHLTPSGWVQGSTKLDFQRSSEYRPVPEDAVLTAYREVYVGAIGATAQVTENTTKLSSDAELINSLMAKFGKPQFGV